MARRRFYKPRDLFKPTSRVLDGEDLTGVKGLGLIICIPKSVIEALKLEEGDQLTWIDYDPETGIIRLNSSGIIERLNISPNTSEVLNVHQTRQSKR